MTENTPSEYFYDEYSDDEITYYQTDPNDRLCDCDVSDYYSGSIHVCKYCLEREQQKKLTKTKKQKNKKISKEEQALWREHNKINSYLSHIPLELIENIRVFVDANLQWTESIQTEQEILANKFATLTNINSIWSDF